MSSAGVEIQEVDLSTRVPGFAGVYGAMVIPASKGPVGDAILIGSDTDLLKKFTYDESIPIGADVSHYSAINYLAKSNKLWIKRAAKNALYGGIVVKSEGSPNSSNALLSGLLDPTAYMFDGTPDTPAVAEVRTIQVLNNGAFYDVAGVAKSFRIPLENGDIHYFFMNVTDGVETQLDPGFVGEIGNIVNINLADDANTIAGKIQAIVDGLAGFSASVSTDTLTVTNANGGACADAADVDAGVTIVTTIQGEDALSSDDEALLLYQRDPGAWGNKLYYKILNYANSPTVVKEPGAFVIQIFKQGNLNVPVETKLCSRVAGAKDGFGNNIFVEDVMKTSEYVLAFSNPVIDENIQPAEITTALQGAGGSDGDVITDADMINAAQEFRNIDKYTVTVLMDGGYATVNYQQELDAIVSSRKDSVALFSVPYSIEADGANYLNGIIEYRRMTLALNSSYSALYTPHVLVYDRFNDRDLYVDPTGYAGAAISYSASNFEIWYPAAGFKRGTIRAKDLLRRYSKTELDALYDAGINPIRFSPTKGIAIWGQKTLSTRPSALDRLNVRMLLILIEPAIADALEDFTFDLNDTALYQLITALIEGYMDRIKAGRGVYDYQVKCDEDNNSPTDIDNYILNCDLYIKPTKSAEFIKFRTIITPTGVSFQVAEDSI